AVVAIEEADWIQVRPVGDANKVPDLHTTTRLGLGECSAMLLAEELGARWLLMDDLAARREAKARSLPVLGTVGTILLAKQRGLIPSVSEVLDELIGHGTRISESLYGAALAVARE